MAQQFYQLYGTSEKIPLQTLMCDPTIGHISKIYFLVFTTLLVKECVLEVVPKCEFRVLSQNVLLLFWLTSEKDFPCLDRRIGEEGGHK